MKAQVTKYKGRPIISLPTDKDYHFSFGKTKAKLEKAVEHYGYQIEWNNPGEISAYQQ